MNYLHGDCIYFENIVIFRIGYWITLSSDIAFEYQQEIT